MLIFKGRFRRSVPLASFRTYASLLTVLDRLSHNPSSVISAANQIKTALEETNIENDENERKSLHSLLALFDLNDSESKRISNMLLSYGLKHDFSLYFTASKLKNFKWTSDSLLALLSANPGRVYSTFELFEKHGDGLEDKSIVSIVAQRLLKGEKVEKADNDDFDSRKDSISKALMLLEKESSKSEPEDVTILLDILSRFNLISALSLFPNVLELITRNMENIKLNHIKFMRLFNISYRNDLSPYSNKVMADLIDNCNKLDPEEVDSDDSLEEKYFHAFLDAIKHFPKAEVDFVHLDSKKMSELKKQILEHIVKSGSDVAIALDSIYLRLKLIETYGMYEDDMAYALQLFDNYRTKSKFGFEFVQNKMAQSFFYQAFKNKNDSYLAVAESLIDPEMVPISLIQSQMIAYSGVSDEKPLEIFNNYIQEVSNTINVHSGRSPAGLLTEALMLSYICRNDREFALLVYEKAVQSGTLKDKVEATQVKKTLRVYGDAFVDDDRDEAQHFIFKHACNYLRAL